MAVMQIGDHLRKARKEAKLTQAQVARLIGASQSRVSQWENGEDYPRLNEYLLFIDITGDDDLRDLRNLPIAC